MVDRIAVLRSSDPIGFVADACAALAESVNEIRVSGPGDEQLLAAYAEMVLAYSRLVGAELAIADNVTQLAIVDHLIDRLRQAQDGTINIPVIDIVDRLHAELAREPASV